VDFLLKKKFENIIIIDNLSTYPPLLEYYKSLQGVAIEYMDKNYGHMVFFEKEELLHKYGKGFFVVTDADIMPNDKLPDNFLKQMLLILLKEFSSVNKVGFALDIENIPDYYIKKDNVIKWETKFWQRKYLNSSTEAYISSIDTTFALYMPNFFQKYREVDFFSGIRLAGNYLAKHGGWYIDYDNLSEEQKYYQKTATNSSSWNLDDNFNFNKNIKTHYNTN